MNPEINRTSGNICCVTGCVNSKSKNPNLKFYRFPGRKWEMERKLKWICAIKSATKSENWKPRNHSRLCSAHFVSGKKSERMSSIDYVPSIFPHLGGFDECVEDEDTHHSTDDTTVSTPDLPIAKNYGPNDLAGTMSSCNKWCFVPGCTSTSKRTPNKIFVTVPRNKTIITSWFKAARRDPPTSKSTFFCCEDHFNLEEDMENYLKYKLVGGNIKIKEEVVPHKFDCQKDRKRAFTKPPRPAAEKRRRIEIIKKAMESSQQSMSVEQSIRQEEILEPQMVETFVPQPLPEPLKCVMPSKLRDNGIQYPLKCPRLSEDAQPTLFPQTVMCRKVQNMKSVLNKNEKCNAKTDETEKTPSCDANKASNVTEYVLCDFTVDSSQFFDESMECNVPDENAENPLVAVLENDIKVEDHEVEVSQGERVKLEYDYSFETVSYDSVHSSVSKSSENQNNQRLDKEQLNNSIVSAVNNSEVTDDCQHFCNFVASELRLHDESVRCEIQNDIMNIILNARKGFYDSAMNSVSSTDKTNNF